MNDIVLYVTVYCKPDSGLTKDNSKIRSIPRPDEDTKDERLWNVESPDLAEWYWITSREAVNSMYK